MNLQRDRLLADSTRPAATQTWLSAVRLATVAEEEATRQDRLTQQARHDELPNNPDLVQVRQEIEEAMRRKDEIEARLRDDLARENNASMEQHRRRRRGLITARAWLESEAANALVALLPPGFVSREGAVNAAVVAASSLESGLTIEEATAAALAAAPAAAPAAGMPLRQRSFDWAEDAQEAADRAERAAGSGNGDEMR